MLSDKERAVLKTAKENYGLTSAEQKILVNLIEKQQKEIEELKEKNKELNKYIEDRAKIGKNIQTFINKDYVEQEYISKDKIKAKIEELEKEISEDKKKNDGFWSDYSIYLDAQREGFQSLFKKEK